MPTNVTMKQLLETGVHFGHRTRKWNPKMEPFIFQARSGVHIIDLQQTLVNLNEIHDLVRDEVARGGNVLFVGTKRQAQEAIIQETARSGSPYVTARWLGGTLTNWKTIKQRIETLKRLERERDEGIFEKMTKKERLMKQREIDRLLARLGGIREMERLPSLLFIIDVTREQTAVREANVLKIPIIGVVDTNGDPDQIDHIIPANDDAIRAIRLLCAAISDAVLEGRSLRKAYAEDKGEDESEAFDYETSMASRYDDDDQDEAFLGEATLAKLRDGDLSFGGISEAEDDAEDEAEDSDDDESGDAEVEAEDADEAGSGDVQEDIETPSDNSEDMGDAVDENENEDE